MLAKHYPPDDAGSNGPSWLTFVAQSKDRLWRVDLFRCESILLCSYWANSRTITTYTGFTGRSTAKHPINAPAHYHLHPYHLLITLGGSIVRVYFRSRPPHDCEFAPYRLETAPPSINPTALENTVAIAPAKRPDNS